MNISVFDCHITLPLAFTLSVDWNCLQFGKNQNTLGKSQFTGRHNEIDFLRISLERAKRKTDNLFLCGVIMYEKLIEKAELYIAKAKETTNLELKIFYLKASKGFKAKAKNLSIEEAE